MGMPKTTKSRYQAYHINMPHEKSQFSFSQMFAILALTLFMSLLLKTSAIAENPSVDEASVLNLRFTAGPTGKVCPLQTVTFTAAANLRDNFQWSVNQNGTWYPNGPFGSPLSAAGTSSSFTYAFLPGSGTITVEVWWYPIPYREGVTPRYRITRTLTMELGAPAPTLATNGLKFCSVNEAQQITIDGIPRTNDPNSCDYHFGYQYEVPNGWLVRTLPNEPDFDPSPTRVQSQSRNVIVTAASGATNGTMTVRTVHPNFTVQRTSQIGLSYGPYTASVLSGPSGGSGSSFVQVNAPNLPGLVSANYQWRVIGGQGGTHASQSGGRFFQFYLPPAGFGAVEVQLTVPDRCRSNPTAVLKLFIYEYGGSYLVYPNPADEYIDITAKSFEPSSNSISMATTAGNLIEAPSVAESNSGLSAPYRVKLLDTQATILYEGEAQDGKLRIDVSRLKRGNYYLHIQEAGKALTKMPILIE